MTATLTENDQTTAPAGHGRIARVIGPVVDIEFPADAIPEIYSALTTEIDLTAQGFTLIGGRLDYVDARPVGAVVYRRRQHVINLFVAQTSSMERRAARIDTLQGFNVRHWSERGLNYWAVSDLARDELADFGERFESAMRAAG